MKRVLSVLLLLSLLALPALADPLPLLEDYTAEIAQPYDENDPSADVLYFDSLVLLYGVPLLGFVKHFP